ncbi:MAG: endonuclease/exonuclease/phosphatase family protein [Clostridia bacterium]|nr:endonuclease/exonuclease/phosphatase family protein [Clostridia bacterium]
MKLRIMSNNIWWIDNNSPAWEEKGENCSAEVRIPGFVRMYSETNPDVIGIQECSRKMVDLLMREISAKKLPYALAWGKDTPVLYRTDRFELVNTEFLIYPEKVQGYEGSFNNHLTKSYCIAVLRIKESGKLFIFASTHLWWMSSDPASKNYAQYSDEAREYQLKMLIDRVTELEKKYGCPSIIAGDMNTRYDSLALKAAFVRGYVHAHDVAAEYADETMGMHYCYGDRFDTKPYQKGFTESIDHILLRGFEDGFVRRFERFSPDYYMPLSDHFPVWIDVELN